MGLHRGSRSFAAHAPNGRPEARGLEIAAFAKLGVVFLGLVAEGIGEIEVDRRLGLRHKTVRNYVSNILTKLQVADREEAIARARDAGLG